MHSQTHTHIHTHIQIHKHTHIYTLTHTLTHTNTCVHTLIHTHMNKHTQALTHIHTCTHSHTHSHTHTHKAPDAPAPSEHFETSQCIMCLFSLSSFVHFAVLNRKPHHSLGSLPRWHHDPSPTSYQPSSPHRLWVSRPLSAVLFCTTVHTVSPRS